LDLAVAGNKYQIKAKRCRGTAVQGQAEAPDKKIKIKSKFLTKAIFRNLVDYTGEFIVRQSNATT
jgi:hypothetical protein